MPLTIEQKGKVVEFYLQTKSIVKTQRQYQRHISVKTAPDRKTIWRTVKKFENERTVHNVNKGRSGRTRSARSQENIEVVRQSAVQSPKKSC